ncbi:outer membrane beta-barrel protein [Pontibacter oryzae]|uniref:Uncharacterized protein n=1 Tax=Pontibacter oryzae TaxID=2304593 RepID=A0A399SG39_9BACT|nr:outer membrane beta-barrel protein [Pontibacter oryzae]RIJ41789.1 hypothetical protein D1627_07155 [Pontibacter oryzae]
MKNKVKIILAAVALLSCNQASEQHKPHEVGVSYGFATSRVLETSFIKLFVPGDDALSALGPIGLKYSYHLNERVNIGMNANFAQLTLRESGGKNGNSSIKSRGKYYTLMPEVNVYLGKKERLEAYSGLALGINHTTYSYNYAERSTEQETNMAYQVTAIGIRTTKQTGLFAELGYGYEGLLQFGLSRRF